MQRWKQSNDYAESHAQKCAHRRTIWTCQIGYEKGARNSGWKRKFWAERGKEDSVCKVKKGTSCHKGACTILKGWRTKGKIIFSARCFRDRVLWWSLCYYMPYISYVSAMKPRKLVTKWVNIMFWKLYKIIFLCVCTCTMTAVLRGMHEHLSNK